MRRMLEDKQRAEHMPTGREAQHPAGAPALPRIGRAAPVGVAQAAQQGADYRFAQGRFADQETEKTARADGRNMAPAVRLGEGQMMIYPRTDLSPNATK